MISALAPAGDIARRAGNAVLCALFALAALYFAATTLFAIVNFGWRQPMFDQWREYEILLGHPFPQDVLQLANGHRPIVPNLFRVAEIRWFAGNQLVQLTVGALGAFLCVITLATAACRERSLPVVARCAGVMLAVLGVLWLANARRLLHGSEALHGYLPTLATLIAMACVWSARRGHALAWISAACAACLIATFSFGPGLASFGAVFAGIILLRLPLRLLVFPAAALLLSLLLYLLALPGGGSAVVASMAPEPVALVRDLAQWIASPFANGWLEFHSTHSDLPRIALTEDLLTNSALALHGFADTDTACAVIGLVGCALFWVLLAAIYLRGEPASRLELLAAGAGVYAFGSAVITVIGRVQYFHVHPDQVYADRYLLWPSLFWCCTALLLLARVANARSVLFRGAGIAALLVLPMLLLPTQNADAIWNAIVYRTSQTAAAALRSGVYDEAHFPTDGLGREADLRQIALLREHRLAMFADPAWQHLGERWDGAIDTTHAIKADLHWLESVDDPIALQPAGRFEGWITQGLAMVKRGAQLTVLSDDRTIAGFAQFSFIRPDSRALRLNAPRKRGFDGYIRDFDKSKNYTFIIADFAAKRALELATLPAQESPQ